MNVALSREVLTPKTSTKSSVKSNSPLVRSLIGELIISGIGQADNTAILSDNIHKLLNLLMLSESFYNRFHLKLCAEKTKVLVFATKKMKLAVDYAKETNPVNIDFC